MPENDLDYIAELTAGLRDLARDRGRDTIAYLLDVAYLQAIAEIDDESRKAAQRKIKA